VLKDPRSRFELHEVIKNGGFLKGLQPPDKGMSTKKNKLQEKEEEKEKSF